MKDYCILQNTIAARGEASCRYCVVVEIAGVWADGQRLYKMPCYSREYPGILKLPAHLSICPYTTLEQLIIRLTESHNVFLR